MTRALVLGLAALVCACGSEVDDIQESDLAATSTQGWGGGKVSLLDFTFVGDTRPGNCDQTSQYPTQTFKSIAAAMAKLNPQFGLDLGDHMFVCKGGVTVARQQMSLYTGAILSSWTRGTPFLMTMGNHECNTGGVAQQCGLKDVNYVAFAEALVSLSGYQNPNHKLDFQTNAGLVRIVITADNQASPADVTTIDGWLSDADKIAKATILVRHHTVDGKRSGPDWVLKLADKHKIAVILVAHDHNYSRSSYKRANGTNIPAVVCGLGGASSAHNGFCRLNQTADGMLHITQYSISGNPMDTWAVPGN